MIYISRELNNSKVVAFSQLAVSPLSLPGCNVLHWCKILDASNFLAIVLSNNESFALAIFIFATANTYPYLFPFCKLLLPTKLVFMLVFFSSFI